MKAKEALKDAQEAIKKAQEVQKKAREEVRRVKESTKEPGMHEHIKALNNDIEVNVESDQSHPLRFSQVLKGNRVNTHQGEGKVISKPNRKTQKKQQDCVDIFNFGIDGSLMLDDVKDVGDTQPAKAGKSAQNTGEALKGGEMEKQKCQGDGKKGNTQ